MPEEVRVPLTRRQIRERERTREAQAEGEAARQADVADREDSPRSLSVTVPTRTSHGQRCAGQGSDSPTEELAEVPGITRRQLRPQPGSSARRPRHVLPRAAVLTVLGLTTIAAPVVGLDGADHSAHAHEAAAAPAVQIQASVLEVLDSRVGAAQVTGSKPESLLANPAAQARAESMYASRAAARGALDGANVEGAHGTIAAAVPEKKIVMPLAQGSFRKTSSYGGRADPFTGGSSSHTGVDLAAPLDTPIHAVADGIVDYVGPGKAGRSSMIIVVKHEIDGEVFYSWYNHMYASGLYVEVGQQVQVGDVIAGVGNNGRSTGPHLHFEIHTDDDLTTTDPLAWLQTQGAVDVGELP
ncbi:M23 family metallopeptidase [Georgenia subflava]|uniref:M23 family metallopeptidase n=1 Tax=Georgenia subflava TaxID=1622177 RepID=UPI00186B01CB|nr:M23 family metallopeptidase [Georgenia subflava]